MRDAKRDRKAVGYRTNTPRCETCVEYRKPYVYLTTYSVPARSQPLCAAHGFTVRPNSVCNAWAALGGTDGVKEKDRG